MNTLTCMRGLPGSGKSTVARSMDAVRTNRDDLRQSIFGGEGILSREKEDLITQIQQKTVSEALSAGFDVVVDDMHLRPKYLKQWNEIANEHGAVFKIYEMGTSLEECIDRDGIRLACGERYVGEDVIRSIAARQMKNGKYLPYTPMPPQTFEPVVQKDGVARKMTILVDIDGTLTMGPHERGPFEWSKVGQDRPRESVVRLVGDLLDLRYHVTFMSGRDSVCRGETLEWLRKVLVTSKDDWDLFMRAEGDMRKDSIVKYELFTQHVLPHFYTRFVIDDRPQVCRMWRQIGLEVLQVGDPYKEF